MTTNQSITDSSLFWLILIIGFLTACYATTRLLAPTEALGPNSQLISDASELPNYGPAPELNNEIWFNTAEPLRLEELRGKVVLLEMWTFG